MRQPRYAFGDDVGDGTSKDSKQPTDAPNEDVAALTSVLDKCASERVSGTHPLAHKK